MIVPCGAGAASPARVAAGILSANLSAAVAALRRDFDGGAWPWHWKRDGNAIENLIEERGMYEILEKLFIFEN